MFAVYRLSVLSIILMMAPWLQGYYNVEKPDDIGPDWSIRFTLQFLFPRGG
jgi:hypothetical protein